MDTTTYRRVPHAPDGSTEHDHLCSCPWCMPDSPDLEDKMKHFYLSHILAFVCVDAVMEELIKREVNDIELIAIEKIALDNLTREDYENLLTRQDAAFLFKVCAGSIERASVTLVSFMEDVYE